MGNETRTEWTTIDGITHGKHEPDAPIPMGPKPIGGVDGYWSGVGMVTAPEQLAKAGIKVNPSSVEAQWGQEGLEKYRTAEAARQTRLAEVRAQIVEIAGQQT